MDDNEKLCCGNCKYASYSRENGYVCENMDSYYLADYVRIRPQMRRVEEP